MSINRSFETDWQVEGKKPDANMEANAAFKACKNPQKINAGIGMVMDHNRAFVPRSIRDIGLQIAFRDTGYLSPTGHLEYLDLHAKHLIFGEELWQELGGLNKTVAVQTIGGTGSLYIASEFLNEVLEEEKRNLLLDPGWANHKNIFAKIDNNPTTYIHEDPETREYNHQGYLEALNNHPEGCPVLLQVAGYNDDGSERNKAQWDEIANIIEEKKHIPILDFAYNGLVNGFGEDNYAIKEFTKKGIPSIVCVSNSKNAGMYNMRLGGFYLVNIDQQQRNNIQGFVANKKIRGVWSNPNALPAAIMAEVLKDEEKRYQFINEINERVVDDILDYNKNILSNVLGENFQWIKNKGGIFFKLIYDGFTPEQVNFLRNEKYIFCPPSSRINVGGLPTARIHEISIALRDAISMT